MRIYQFCFSKKIGSQKSKMTATSSDNRNINTATHQHINTSNTSNTWPPLRRYAPRFYSQQEYNADDKIQGKGEGAVAHGACDLVDKSVAEGAENN